MHWVSWEKMCKTRKEGGLGFRDIGEFLLAKQAWRLLTKPDSLLTRVYKARYFKQKDFMNAVVGSRPSFAWRNIIHGRDLLEKGIMKNIGNGQSTSVWNDKWIFDKAPRRPFNKQSLFDLELMVSNLITHQGSWDHALLSELFFPPDVVRIMSYPPNIGLEHSYIWAYNRNGCCYTVKSGNWLISHLKQQPPPPTHEQVTRCLKKKIWDLKTLPKIKMFLWRALSGVLVVSTCLQAHDNIGFMLKLMSNVGVPLPLRMAIPWILWGIWKHRNETLYAGGRCGGAWLVRDAQGDVLFHAREMFLPASNRIAAELRGILWVLQSLRDLHLDNIEVWSDCGAAIEAIIDSSNWPRYSTYLDKIHRIISSFSRVIFMASSSKANLIAREIALSVTRDGRTRSYLSRGGPVWLSSRIEEEKRR
ncbi:hypothetical protein AXX17_AT5G35100 [Arabidopsis thaliana]|uniref:RNase H type-1 domain-containing protein n=1 Tax=Arabidopsis thaliana TaxID=3702 RepID=A0A178UH41_ARATH|nr:hypothetical protein AXX17_AT5G35100 [Arabidopsis thaliana]